MFVAHPKSNLVKCLATAPRSWQSIYSGRIQKSKTACWSGTIDWGLLYWPKRPKSYIFTITTEGGLIWKTIRELLYVYLMEKSEIIRRVRIFILLTQPWLQGSFPQGCHHVATIPFESRGTLWWLHGSFTCPVRQGKKIRLASGSSFTASWHRSTFVWSIPQYHQKRPKIIIVQQLCCPRFFFKITWAKKNWPCS